MGLVKRSAYILKRAWNKIQYGMVLQVLRDYLAKIGIEITPYYLLMEKPSDGASVEPQGDFSEYSLAFFGPDEIKVMATIPGREYILEEYMLSNLKKGKKCLGMKYKGQIACFTWFDFEECSFKGTKFSLKENEVYLFDLYTLKSFRGRNLAPYLRYHSYKILTSMGKDAYYSITEWYNRPSLRFKKKLDARFLKLRLNIELFGKYRRHWTVKNYG